MLGDIQAALGNKNPQVKEGTLKFLGRCLSTSPTPIASGDIKPLSEQLAGLMEDSFEGARNEAAHCLGTLMKMVGERPLGAVMESLADVRKVKVKEAFETATVKAKAGGPKAPSKAPPAAVKPPPKPAAPKAAPKAAAPALAPAAPPPVEESESLDAFVEDKPLKKPPARFMVRPSSRSLDMRADITQTKKAPAPAAAASAPTAPVPAAAPAPVKKAPPPVAAGKSKPPPPAAPGQLDTFKYKYTPEDAEGLIADLIPSSIQTDFADPNWKTRLAALEEMTTWVEGAVGGLEAELVVRFLAKKGWSEKNFQVRARHCDVRNLWNADKFAVC
jgi:cytoskeleton-associated protein 5